MEPRTRIVVVSPHLDDGVLSLGAWMASQVRAGERVELLTVFACDPESDAPTKGWDARGGFRTEGKAARARREEDLRACALLGVTPVWLPFGSVDYERHGDEETVRAAVVERVDGAHSVLMPGHPSTQPDHAWLRAALEPVVFPAEVGRYAEQPYTSRGGPPPGSFERVSTSLRDRFAKWRAIREYRSQLPLLAMRRSLTRGTHRRRVHARGDLLAGDYAPASMRGGGWWEGGGWGEGGGGLGRGRALLGIGRGGSKRIYIGHHRAACRGRTAVLEIAVMSTSPVGRDVGRSTSRRLEDTEGHIVADLARLTSSGRHLRLPDLTQVLQFVNDIPARFAPVTASSPWRCDARDDAGDIAVTPIESKVFGGGGTSPLRLRGASRRRRSAPETSR